MDYSFDGQSGPSGARLMPYSAVYNSLSTVDVMCELINYELLITDYAFDKIAD